MMSQIIVLLAFVYFLTTGTLIARNCVGVSGFVAFLLSPLAIAVPLGVFGSILYLFWGLSHTVFVVLLFLPAFLALCSFYKPAPPLSLSGASTRRSWIQTMLLVLFFLALGSTLAILLTTQTTESFLGPWDGMPPIFFTALFLASFLLAALVWTGIPSLLAVILLTAQFLVAIAVAFVRFPLGFGFDPILHHAAEQLVLNQGVVTPKTLYYLAQNVLVPFFARVFDFSVAAVHQPLTLILLGLSLPLLLVIALRQYVRNPLVLALCFFVIPFPHFIMTTPWGLAYGTTFLALLSSELAASTRTIHHWMLACMFALFTLMLHPLAGIPVIFFLSILACSLLRRRLLMAVTFILGALSIPLAFIANSILSQQFRLSFRLPALNDIKQIIALSGTLETRFSPILDAAYFVFYNGHWILLALAATGFFLSRTKLVDIRLRPFLQGCGMTAIFIALSGVITYTTLRIDSLAGFEQQDYAKRLFEVAALFLLPFVAIALDELFSRIQKSHSIVRLATIVMLGGLVTISIYISYPRNDAYVPSHAYTLSITDVRVVRLIENNAQGTDYVVLANQVAASAAIREFGFKKYFDVNGSPTFYYPVPSGSPLIPIYLDMLRAPSQATAITALDLTGASRLYLIVRDYEFRFPIIIRDAKKTADEWWKVDEGRAYIFLYK